MNDFTVILSDCADPALGVHHVQADSEELAVISGIQKHYCCKIIDVDHHAQDVEDAIVLRGHLDFTRVSLKETA